MKRRIIAAILAFVAVVGTAQKLTYGDYMQRVCDNNTALVAREMNIEIAQALVKGSKVYNDPTLSVEYANNEDWNKNLGQSVAAQLSRTFTFGVRKAGINLAQKELQATKAVFADYMRNFHADATIAFLTHVRAKELLDVAIERELFMKKLSHSDSLRFLRGDIAKTTWIETRLAAGLSYNQRLAAEAEFGSTAVALGYYMGSFDNVHSLDVECTLVEMVEPLADLNDYIGMALDNRADILLAISSADIAEAQRKLGSASRRMDINLSLGAEYNKADPSFTKLKVGASVPLKFSNINSGARNAERIRVQQAQQEVVDTRMMVQSEVMQAYNNCLKAKECTDAFVWGMLDDVTELLHSKRKAYEAGEISFVEFIETERSTNIIQEEFINAKYSSAVKYVELLRSVGVASSKE